VTATRRASQVSRDVLASVLGFAMVDPANGEALRVRIVAQRDRIRADAIRRPGQTYHEECVSSS